MDVADLTMKGLVLQARAFDHGGLDLELGPGPGVGLYGPRPVPSLQHGLVLRTWTEKEEES